VGPLGQQDRIRAHGIFNATGQGNEIRGHRGHREGEVRSS
jgi:hypothetical protein